MPYPIDRANWMAQLRQDLRVIDTYIPGSHDASSYQEGIPNLVAEAGGAITQGGNYMDQLNVGIRYFDMRCQWHREYYVGDRKIYLHHSKINFDTLENVLKTEIVPFANAHPTEVIFLDIDVNDDEGKGDAYDEQATEIVRLLLQYISTDRIATAHLNGDGTLNTEVTWSQLRGTEKKQQFVLFWSYEKGNLGHQWMGNNNTLRWSPYGDFNKHEVPWILSYLDDRVKEWKTSEHAKQLFVAQVINTPGISFAPGDEPRVKDYFYRDDLNGWVTKHPAGSNLNVVLRDFVNKDYNQQALEYLINMNFVEQSPPLLLAPARSNQANMPNEARPYVFYSNNVDFNFCGTGRLFLSSLSANPDTVFCDDEVTLEVSNAYGGEPKTLKHDFSRGNSGTIYPEMGGIEVTNLFPRAGNYKVSIKLTDLYPSDFSASNFYLVWVAPYY
ncbi:MAG: hypothetical protein HUU01_15015 [Saprospiraceae bacterium]|nr:hypothetical protein [Saprospiraceae bacterium]